MCLLAVVNRVVPGVPLVLLANREEDRSRPSAPPGIVARVRDRPAWMGGIDLVAGGTWLGINEHRLLAAVTNRPHVEPPDEPRSRGLLCRDVLGCRTVAEAVELVDRQLRTHPFAGFGLLVWTAEESVVIEHADRVIPGARLHDGFSVLPLAESLHVMTNGTVNDPQDGRVQRVHRELARITRDGQTAPDDWVQAGGRICGLRGEGQLPAVCLEGGKRGTVSSSLVVVAETDQESRYAFAPGPPSTTPYRDLSQQLQRLLSGS